MSQALGGKALEVFTKFFADKKKLELFAKSTESMSNIADHSEELFGYQEAINTFMSYFKPLAVPLQLLASELGSETLGDNINLMNTMLELMKDENVKKGIEVIVYFLKFLIYEFGAKLYILGEAVKLLGFLTDKLSIVNGGLRDFIDRIADSNTKLGMLISWLKELSDTLDDVTDKVNNFFNEIMGGGDMSPSKWEVFNEAVPDVVKPLFGLLGWFGLL